METNFKHVQRQDRLSLQVAEQIENMILSGSLKLEEKLPPERDLCGTFGVSRTVIREAVRILEAKGLLLSQGGSGTDVKAPRSEDVSDSISRYLTTQGEFISHEDMMEVRRVLEVQTAALAAKRATEEALEDLEILIEKMDLSKNEPETFANYDLEFHVALAHATGNKLFALLLNPFMDAMYDSVLASNQADPPDWTLEMHRKIYEEIRKQDPDGASDAMRHALAQERPPVDA